MINGRYQLLRGTSSQITPPTLNKIMKAGVAFSSDTNELLFVKDEILHRIAGENIGTAMPGAFVGEVFQDLGSPGPQRTVICGTGVMLRFEGVIFLSGSMTSFFVPNETAVYTPYQFSIG